MSSGTADNAPAQMAPIPGLQMLLCELVETIEDLTASKGQRGCTKRTVFSKMLKDHVFEGTDIPKYTQLLAEAKKRNLIEVDFENDPDAEIWLKL